MSRGIIPRCAGLRPQTSPGVRLRDDGYVLLTNPLRVLRIKPLALALLRRCDGQRPLDELLRDPALRGLSLASASAFLDRLADAGVVALRYPLSAVADLRVSLVVPVRNRPEALARCLESCLALQLPPAGLEILVVDDASTDETPVVAARYPVRLLRQAERRGASACRNRGWREATGDVIAFLDSDCAAEPDWLGNLLPLFADPRLAAAGGAIRGQSLDGIVRRYEDAASALNLGPTAQPAQLQAALSYLPSAALLVRRTTLAASGGFDEAMHLGEDVDLCWRLAEAGWRLAYEPAGVVRHDHRAAWAEFARRRAEYGSADADLLRRHPAQRRLFYLPLPFLGVLGAGGLALARRHPAWALLAALPLAVELVLKARRLRRIGLAPRPGLLIGSTLRGYGTLLYHLGHNLARYYASPLLLAGLLIPGRARRLIWGTLGAALVGPALVDFRRRRPRLDPLRFVACAAVDHLSYHAGVLWGVVRHRNPAPLLPRVRLF